MPKEEKTPFFKTDDSLFKYSSDMLIIGTAMLICGVYLNGITALYQAAVCCAVAVLSEYVSFKLVLKKNTLGNLSSLCTGLIISLMLPACAPLWLGAMASAFAVIAAKLPFGGARYAPFVPACAGVCFVSLCFPEYMFTYASSASYGLFCTDEAFTAGTSLLSLLSAGKSVSLNMFGRISLLSGTYPGAIGTTSMLVMLAAVIYLLIRRPKRLFATCGYVLACAVFAIIFPRVNSGVFSSAVLELSAGSLMFTAIMLVNDPVTSPKDSKQAVLYGALSGIICMLLRRYAKIEDPSCFGILIINALWPVLVREEKVNAPKKTKRKKIKLSEISKKSEVSGDA